MIHNWPFLSLPHFLTHSLDPAVRPVTNVVWSRITVPSWLALHRFVIVFEVEEKCVSDVLESKTLLIANINNNKNKRSFPWLNAGDIIQRMNDFFYPEASLQLTSSLISSLHLSHLQHTLASYRHTFLKREKTKGNASCARECARSVYFTVGQWSVG